jgi:thioredoxin reductase (NADPH)
MTRDHQTEVIIVGGGPAGLSAGIYLARYLRDVALFDMGHGRSTHHQINHNYLGFPGGAHATEIRERGLAQLREYDHVRIEHHKVESIDKVDGEFVARGQFGSTRGKAVLLATGVLDHYPHFHHWESFVGTSMFWCITCDGYESRGKKIVVAGHTNGAAGEALQLSRLSNDITVITNSHANEIDDKHLSRLAVAGIPVLHDKIHAAEGEDGVLRGLETVEGHVVPVEALFVVQGATPETSLAAMLGVELTENGYILIDTEQHTSVEGVFAAGDITQLHSHQVSAAVHEGAQAASAVNYYLYPPELKAD